MADWIDWIKVSETGCPKALQISHNLTACRGRIRHQTGTFAINCRSMLQYAYLFQLAILFYPVFCTIDGSSDWVSPGNYSLSTTSVTLQKIDTIIGVVDKKGLDRDEEDGTPPPCPHRSPLAFRLNPRISTDHCMVRTEASHLLHSKGMLRIKSFRSYLEVIKEEPATEDQQVPESLENVPASLVNLTRRHQSSQCLPSARLGGLFMVDH